MFTTSAETLLLGKLGRPELTYKLEEAPMFPVKTKEIKGFLQAIALYKWHMEHNTKFEIDYIEEVSNGDILV
jgi:hypothetical protein